MASNDDEWDTSANDEAPQDKYNQARFSGNHSGAAAAAAEDDDAQEPPAQAVSEMNIANDEAPAPPTPPPEADAGDATAADEEQVEAPAAPAPVKTTTLPPENLERQAAASGSPVSGDAGAKPTSSSGSKNRRGSSSPASAPADAPDFLKGGHAEGGAFTEKLSEEALAFFNELCEKPFAEQAQSFLNAYWSEVGSQAEFIFTAAYPTILMADQRAKGIEYVHLYEEGNDLDFNFGLLFFEKLCKKVLDDDEGKQWREDPQWAPSMPEMQTAIKRKIELRERVDCNFDGRVSFLEYLLYQYREHANPADFTHRAMKHEDTEEHPEIAKARAALAEVTKAIAAYEAEKHRLEELAAKPGVKGLGAKHQLAILDASPLAETLNKSLITAEAAVRIAARKFGDGKVVSMAPAGSGAAAAAAEQAPAEKPTQGSLWWLSRDLEEKQKRYGKRNKK